MIYILRSVFYIFLFPFLTRSFDTIFVPNNVEACYIVDFDVIRTSIAISGYAYVASVAAVARVFTLEKAERN